MFISSDNTRVDLTASGSSVCCFWPVMYAGDSTGETRVYTALHTPSVRV